MAKGNPYHVSKGKQEGGRFTSPTGESGGTPSIDKAAAKFGKAEQQRAQLKQQIAGQAVKAGAQAKGLMSAVRKGASLPESQSADIKMTAGSGGGAGTKPPVAPFDKVDQLPKPQGGGSGTSGDPNMTKGVTDKVRKMIAALQEGTPHSLIPGSPTTMPGPDPTPEERAQRIKELEEGIPSGGKAKWKNEGTTPGFSNEPAPAKNLKEAKLNLTKKTQNMIPHEEEQRLAGIGYWQARRDKYMVGPKKDRFDQHALIADLKAQGYTDGPIMDRIVGHAAMNAWDKPKPIIDQVGKAAALRRMRETLRRKGANAQGFKDAEDKEAKRLQREDEEAGGFAGAAEGKEKPPKESWFQKSERERKERIAWLDSLKNAPKNEEAHSKLVDTAMTAPAAKMTRAQQARKWERELASKVRENAKKSAEKAKKFNLKRENQ